MGANFSADSPSESADPDTSASDTAGTRSVVVGDDLVVDHSKKATAATDSMPIVAAESQQSTLQSHNGHSATEPAYSNGVGNATGTSIQPKASSSAEKSGGASSSGSAASSSSTTQLPPQQQPSRFGIRVHLSSRIIASNEDEGLLKAIAAVGWVDWPTAAGAAVAFHYANTQASSVRMAGVVFSRFPCMPDCCRKAIFAQVLARTRRLLPQQHPLHDGRLLPRQWALPRQRTELKNHVEAAAAACPAGASVPAYIVKPDAGAQGHGIEITTTPCARGSLADGPYARDAVVQEYIPNPMLLEGLKFDLRLYVLVTSVGGDGDGSAPLRAFVFREGLVRLATIPYDGSDLKRRHAHLTNYSLNKNAKGFATSEEADGGQGSKRSVSAVFNALKAAGSLRDVEALWKDIDELVSRTLSLVQPVLAGARGQWCENPCFQILGFDVLLDNNAHPWLVEINDHPSLRIDHTVKVALRGGGESFGTDRGERECASAVDEAIKVPLLCDTLRILGEIHGLPYSPRSSRSELHALLSDSERAAGRWPFAHNTGFVEVRPSAAEVHLMAFFDRLRNLMGWHATCVQSSELERRSIWACLLRECRDDASGAFQASHRPQLDATRLPGPRWKLREFTSLLGELHSSRATVEEAEQIFVATCGKGGSMDALDLAEALAEVAQTSAQQPHKKKKAKRTGSNPSGCTSGQRGAATSHAAGGAGACAHQGDSCPEAQSKLQSQSSTSSPPVELIERLLDSSYIDA